MNPLTIIRNWLGGRRAAVTYDPSPSADFWFTTDIDYPVSAGVTVTESTALTYSAVWAATRLLASTIGWLPLDLYRRLDDDGREVVRDDRRENLLHDRPNAEMSAMMFRCQGVNQQVNSGNCYAEIERDNLDSVIALWPIHHSRVRIVRESQGGRLLYEIRNDSGPPSYLEQADMLHVPSPISDDGICGKGVIRHARETIGFGLATERYGAKWFGGGGVPRVVITSPKLMNPEARANFRKEWKEIYGGPEGDKVALLTAGAEAKPLNISNEDSQFLTTRQHNVEEIARWYGVPPHMLQHLLRSTFNNIEHQGIEFVKYSLMPWIKLWEQELWAKLLTPEEQQTMYFEFNVTALLRGDSKARGEFYRELIFTGMLSPNEARAMENMNPYDGGDVYMVQSAMVPIDKLEDLAEAQTEPSQPAPSPDGKREPVEEAARAMLEGTISRMTRKETTAIRRAANKPNGFLAWSDSFYERHEPLLADALTYPTAACRALGYEITATTLAGELVNESRTALLDLTGKATAANFATMTESLMQDWERDRAVTATEKIFYGVTK